MPRNRNMVRVLLAFVLFGICGGSIVALVIYADAHTFTFTGSPVNHTQNNLLDLAEVAEQLDRIELDARLYRITTSEEYLRTAQSATVALNTISMRLQEQMREDPAEEANAKDLIAAAVRLTASVKRITPDATTAMYRFFTAPHTLGGSRHCVVR